MRDTFWIGVWPGLNQEHLTYAANQLRAWLGLDAIVTEG
jgi:hypothetical protein